MTPLSVRNRPESGEGIPSAVNWAATCEAGMLSSISRIRRMILSSSSAVGSQTM
ncbi:MAG: hypothetical protein U9N87_10110 [Planctomycetota bacterium]|nr:hypothetical protein [Planctomycetota bacterium]